MNPFIQQLFYSMITYMSGDPRRIQHFVKVHAYSRLIGSSEELDEHTLLILEAAALMHDIGIREGERLYQRNDGQIQEQLGPAEAAIDGMDYQILVEADFLVNLQEEHSSMETCRTVGQKIFRTETGKRLLTEIYDL